MKWKGDERGVLALPSGRLVRGCRWSPDVEDRPERASYALWRDPSPAWPHDWVRWPDFGLPASRERAWDAIEQAWRAAESERVEVACGGGRGRTGTILAAMAILDGLSPDDATALLPAETVAAHRRRGLAGHLIGRAARWSSERGAPTVRHRHGADQPGGRLYRSVGFIPVPGSVGLYRPPPAVTPATAKARRSCDHSTSSPRRAPTGASFAASSGGR